MEIFTIDNLLALLTLTALEIVLGIDNLVVIAIIVQKLNKKLQAKARFIGLALAMVFRIVLLLSISWIMQLQDPLFAFFNHPFSGRDILLLVGGIFLIFKATKEIHSYAEHDLGQEHHDAKPKSKFSSAIMQIIAVDLVFSLDSVMTAIGMAKELFVMVLAIILSMIFMLFFTKYVNDFIERHPTLKMLALSFVLLIGVVLVADGCGKHIERAYIYFAMGFSLFVESMNLRKREKPSI
ncbi:MAG: TerC family protein [bacterium]|nr:TerC family protein [bacterium]